MRVVCWLFQGWVSRKQIVLGMQFLPSSCYRYQQMLWWNDLVLITGRVKEQITVQGAGPLPCAIGIFFWWERFSLKGACLNPWESLKWGRGWRRQAPRHPSASVPGRLWLAHLSVFCFKELMLCRESWDVLVCIQECSHWLLSPLLVTQ